MSRWHLYSPREIHKAAASGQILARILGELKENIAPGVSLLALDRLARDRARRYGAVPAFLGYQPLGTRQSYPAALCTSLNDVIVHGVPTDYRLRKGDILKIDFGVVVQGFFSDAAFTIGVEATAPSAHRLIRATREALDNAIKEALPGKRLGDVGFAISETARRYGVAVAMGLTGHGVGRRLHENPAVPNVGRPGKGLELRSGAIIAIEPMFSLGTGAIRQLTDESWATQDGSLSAHFEHTVAVTKDGPRVLTIAQ